MKKFSDYELKNLWEKHVPGGIYGNDPLYDGAYEAVKDFVVKLKRTIQFAKHDIIIDTEHLFDAIDDIRKSNLQDKDYIELCVRLCIVNNIKEINTMIDEINQNT